MAADRTIQTIMFADVSGSSRLYKKQGNTEAKARIDHQLAAARSVIENHGGTVVKTLGDEIMARFASAEAGFAAACDIQNVKPSGDAPLVMRIGMAYGEILMDASGDVFGQVVNDAADVAHIARGHQVVVTDHMVDALPPEQAHRCQPFDRVQLKGGPDLRTVYRLHWETPTQQQSATMVMAVQEIAAAAREHCLSLSGTQGQTRYRQIDLPLALGRDQSRVDWAITSHRASREHCDIIYRRGKFVLVDHSTNGTYIEADGAESVYIRREEAPLTGTGRIGIGEPPGDNRSVCTVCYAVGPLANDFNSDNDDDKT